MYNNTMKQYSVTLLVDLVGYSLIRLADMIANGIIIVIKESKNVRLRLKDSPMVSGTKG
jgi:hypothetical protein